MQRLISPALKNSIKKLPKTTNTRAKMLTLSVDGNISSGKSTLVNKLLDFFPKHGTPISSPKKIKLDPDAIAPIPMSMPLPLGLGNVNIGKFHMEVIPEPLEKWCNLEGYNLLELFYKAPEKHNFLFQHYVQLTRLQDTIGHDKEKSEKHHGHETDTLKLRIMERSLQNNRHCFLELAQKSGKLHPAEFAVLVEWYNWLEKNMNLNLDLIIYLRTKPETAYQRMKARGRAEEDSCPVEYLQNLHQAYEDWLIKSPNKKNNTDPGHSEVKTNTKSHVIVLDANKSKEEVSEQCFKLLREYLDSLNNSDIPN